MEVNKAYTAKIYHGGITISIKHESSRYGHFTISRNGALSIQTDYGSYDALWSGQPNMIKFLKGCNAEYIMNNIERSFRNQISRKKPESIPQFHYSHLQNLVVCFLEELKTIPDQWELKLTERLQLKDGKKVIDNSYFINSKMVDGDIWYIYFDSIKKSFLLAINNQPDMVFCIPSSVAAEFI